VNPLIRLKKVTPLFLVAVLIVCPELSPKAQMLNTLFLAQLDARLLQGRDKFTWNKPFPQRSYFLKRG
jgi:hypothetical protein